MKFKKQKNNGRNYWHVVCMAVLWLVLMERIPWLYRYFLFQLMQGVYPPS
jgi:hypothetical protein